MVWGGKDWDMTAYPGTHSNWGYIFAWDRAVLGIGLESKLGSRVKQSKQKWKEIVCKGKSFGWVWQLFLLANVREYLSNSSWTMTHITIIKPRKRLRPAWEFFKSVVSGGPLKLILQISLDPWRVFYVEYVRCSYIDRLLEYIHAHVKTASKASKHLKARSGPRVSDSFCSHPLGSLWVTVLARNLLAACEWQFCSVTKSPG